MSQPLPTGGFRWVDIEPNEISELATRTDKGYILEVDVSYPAELHNPHNDLPFMCERMEINGVEKLVQISEIKRITSFTLRRWIKHSPTDWFWIESIEQSNSISLHG